jgi:hypothetical protein
LHLLAIGFYFFTKHENLVRAMITGDKTLDFAAQSANDQTSDRLKALLIITVCAVVVSGLVIWIG